MIRTLGEIFLKRQLGKSAFSAIEKKHRAPLAVLFPSENLQMQQTNLEFCKSLENVTGIKAVPLVFMPKKLDRNVRFSFPHYSYGDLSLTGRPNNKNIDLFTQRNYHTLINLDVNNHASLHYISHKIAAHHKLAINPTFPKLYDIVIHPEASATYDSIQAELVEILMTLAIA